MRQRCIVRHNMPVVLFGGIFATVPLFGVVMRYTIRLFSSLITSGLYPDIGFADPPIVTCHGVLCARFLWARITLFLFVVYSSVKLSEIHHPPDRAMSERWPREEWDKKCRFFDQKRTKITYLCQGNRIKILIFFTIIYILGRATATSKIVYFCLAPLFASLLCSLYHNLLILCHLAIAYIRFFL